MHSQQAELLEFCRHWATHRYGDLARYSPLAHTVAVDTVADMVVAVDTIVELAVLDTVADMAVGRVGLAKHSLDFDIDWATEQARRLAFCLDQVMEQAQLQSFYLSSLGRVQHSLD